MTKVLYYKSKQRCYDQSCITKKSKKSIVLQK